MYQFNHMDMTSKDAVNGYLKINAISRQFFIADILQSGVKTPNFLSLGRMIQINFSFRGWSDGCCLFPV